jgi:hypothetical protein
VYSDSTTTSADCATECTPGEGQATSFLRVLTRARAAAKALCCVLAHYAADSKVCLLQAVRGDAEFLSL